MAFGKPKAEFEITAKNKSQRAFDQVRGDLSRIKSGVSSILGPVALLGAATGIAIFGRKTLQAADSIGKFADRIGITTGELQKIRFAFDLAGVSVEGVDKGLLNFGKRLGKARQGIGALAGGLKGGQEELLETLKATDNNTEALDVLFDAMGNATDQAEKLAIADAAFGGAGLKMTAAFRDGFTAFREAKLEAEQLGIVLDDSLIRNAEKLNDEFTKASAIIETQFQVAFLGLVPAISSATTALTQFIKDAGELKRLFFGPDDTTVSQIKFIEEEIKRLTDLINGTSIQGGSFSIFGFDFKERTEEEIKEAQRIYQVAIDELKVELGILRASLKGPPTPGGDQDPEDKKALATIASRGAGTTRKFLTPLEKLVVQSTKLNEELAEGAITANTFDKAMSALMKTFEKATTLPGANLLQQETSPKSLAAHDKLNAKLQRREALLDKIRNPNRLPSRVQQELDDIDSLVSVPDGDFGFTGGISKLQAERAKAAVLGREGIINTGQQFGLDANLTTKQIAERKEMNQVLEDEKIILDLIRDPLDEYARLEEVLKTQYEDSKISLQQYTDGLANLRQQYSEFPDAASEVLSALDSINSGLERDFTQTLFNATRGIDSWRDSALTAIDLVIKEILRLAVVKPIIDTLFGRSGSSGGIFGGILSIAGILFGGGGAGALAGSGAIGELTDFSTQGFAHGGSAMVPGSGGPDSQLAVLKVSPREKITVETPAQQRGSGGVQIIMDLRGSNGDAAIQAAVERGIRRAAPIIVNRSVLEVKKGKIADPNFFA